VLDGCSSSSDDEESDELPLLQLAATRATAAIPTTNLARPARRSTTADPDPLLRPLLERTLAVTRRPSPR
jgi:hypothetical protein